MHEHYRIQEALWPSLSAAGFTIESENDDVDYYGSIRTIFACGEKRVLLEWDGEEGFGYAEVWRDDGWQSLATKVLESQESGFRAAVQQLQQELGSYLEGNSQIT
jgi:hypothetical protein